MSAVVSKQGEDALWTWFCLSYACWLTLPRTLMHAMPDEWQGKMAALLNEFDEEFPRENWCDDRQYFVTARRDGKFFELPDWCSRSMYRHPNRALIDSMRRPRP